MKKIIKRFKEGDEVPEGAIFLSANIEPANYVPTAQGMLPGTLVVNLYFLIDVES